MSSDPYIVQYSKLVNYSCDWLLLFVVVQSLCCVWLFVTLCPAARLASLSFTISQSLLKLLSIESTNSSSVTLFCSYPQSFPMTVSFPGSRLFASGGQSIGASASSSILPMNIQGWFPLGLTGLISCSPRGSQESSSAPQLESISYSVLSCLYGPVLTPIHDYWKNHSFDLNGPLLAKWCPAFNMLSRFVIAFLPRSKSLHFVAAVTICSDSGAQEKKICHCFPFYLPWSDGTGCLDLHFFEYWVLSQLFHSPLSPSSRDSLVPLHFLPLEWYFCISEIVDISPGNLDSSLCFIHPCFSWCTLHIS